MASEPPPLLKKSSPGTNKEVRHGETGHVSPYPGTDFIFRSPDSIADHYKFHAI